MLRKSTVLIAFLFALFPFSPSIAAQNATNILVKMSVQPGKPGAPEEIIECLGMDKIYKLHVARIGGGKTLREQTVTLSHHDFQAVRSIINLQQLQKFSPQVDQTHKIDDGATTAVLIHLPATSRDKAISLNTEWYSNILNAEQVRPLEDELAKLARNLSPNVPLYYWPK